MKEQLKNAELTASSTSTENEERRVAAVKKEYEDQISSLNEQISIMEQALKEEEEKTNKMKEEMDVGELAPMRKTSGNGMHYLDKHSNAMKRK